MKFLPLAAAVLFATSCGKDDDNVGDNYASWETDNKWTDLFGWGMWLDGTAAASIIQTKTDGTYNPATTNNEFSNNTTTVEGTEWFTLSSAQWQYLFNTRGGTDAIRYAKATVCGKTGVILLPDGWSASTTLNNTNTFDAAYNVNVFEKESDWKPLEDAGAVFLPAAGSVRKYSTLAPTAAIGRVRQTARPMPSTCTSPRAACTLITTSTVASVSRFGLCVACSIYHNSVLSPQHKAEQKQQKQLTNH